MRIFERIGEDLYLLKVPFGAYWTGVVWIKGNENILIDSGPSADMVDEVILPALAEEGCRPGDIRYLVCTHTHGDHIGGHARLLEQCPSCIAVASSAQAAKLADPLTYAKIIRTRFPSDSPPVQTGLRGVQPGRMLEDGELLAGRLRLIPSPGHDTDCVSWLDTLSGTLFTGDSVQGEGAAGAGLAFYQSLRDYRASLTALLDTAAHRLVAGHDYAPHGYLVEGTEAVNRYLSSCLSVTSRYDGQIRQLQSEGLTEPADLARRLIAMENRAAPPYLFLEMYTVTAHVQEAAL